MLIVTDKFMIKILLLIIMKMLNKMMKILATNSENIISKINKKIKIILTPKRSI